MSHVQDFVYYTVCTYVAKCFCNLSEQNPYFSPIILSHVLYYVELFITASV